MTTPLPDSSGDGLFVSRLLRDYFADLPDELTTLTVLPATASKPFDKTAVCDCELDAVPATFFIATDELS